MQNARLDDRGRDTFNPQSHHSPPRPPPLPWLADRQEQQNIPPFAQHGYMAPREMPTYIQPTAAKQVVTLKGVPIWDGKEGLLHFHKYQRELNESDPSEHECLR